MVFRIARLLKADNCPVFIENEAKLSEKQSFFETQLFGADSCGVITEQYRPLKSGKPSKYTKTILTAVDAVRELIEKHVSDYLKQTTITLDGQEMTLNLFPAVIQKGDVKFVAGVNFELVSKLHRHVVTRWDDFYVHLDSAFFMALYFLNNNDIVSGSLKGNVHYVHWLVDTAGANLMLDVAPNEVRLYEGRETFRRVKEIMDHRGEKIPNLFSCVECSLNCDERMNIYRE